MNAITVIGIDCSATPGKTGLALGVYENGQLHYKESGTDTGSVKADRRIPPAQIVEGWIQDGQPTLLAIDAPLGWPLGMRSFLSEHSAGQPLTLEPNDLFMRHTDREIRRRFNLQPFSVGADRIARTAHAALQLLKSISSSTGFDIPLAWSRDELSGIQVIEVYPTATRRGYEGERPGPEYAREQQLLRDKFADTNANGHRRDACTCLLAAHDFLEGIAIGPVAEEMDTAKTEGWIWAAGA